MCEVIGSAQLEQLVNRGTNDQVEASRSLSISASRTDELQRFVEMALKIPVWLNAQFVQKILNKSKNDNSIEVTNIETNCATEKGDNYLSDIIRATIIYSRDDSGQKLTKSMSLIFKLVPATGVDAKTMVLELGAFDTEIKMMETTLEKMNDMLVEGECRFNPRLLHYEKGNSPFLVLEDLNPLGYRLTDRKAGLDLEHCKLVMRKIAMFHATSVALSEKDPSLMKTYRRGVFHADNPEGVKIIFEDTLKLLATQVLSWQELQISYGDKLSNLSKVCWEKAIKICEVKDNAFNVINHGDAWANNLLFRYNDSGKVSDLIFVDFQMCIWNSPVIDISHFMSTSISEQVELHHTDILLVEYVNVLTMTMSKLGCKTKPPSITELKKTLEDYELLAVLSSAVGFGLIMGDPNDIRTFQEIINQGDDYVNPVYKNPNYRRRMVRRLIMWNSHGVFDV